MNPVNFSLLLGSWCNNKNSANGNWANTDLGPKLECSYKFVWNNENFTSVSVIEEKKKKK